jgi:hypothetical protein
MKALDYLAQLLYFAILKVFHHEQDSEQAKRNCKKYNQFQQNLQPPLHLMVKLIM